MLDDRRDGTRGVCADDILSRSFFANIRTREVFECHKLRHNMFRIDIENTQDSTPNGTDICSYFKQSVIFECVVLLRRFSYCIRPENYGLTIDRWSGHLLD